MTAHLISRVLAVTLMAASLPMTSALATTSSQGTVMQSGRDPGPYVSQPFAAGRTTTPLKALPHRPSATRVDPGEGLGRGHASTTKARGAKDPVLQTSKTLASATTKAAPTFEAGQENHGTSRVVRRADESLHPA